MHHVRGEQKTEKEGSAVWYAVHALIGESIRACSSNRHFLTVHFLSQTSTESLCDNVTSFLTLF